MIMKCTECPEYNDCSKKYNLTIKRKRCPKAKEENVVTNADRIRAMSDEELAEDYCKTLLKVMHYFGIKNTGILEDAVRARLEWLKQPVEVEK
jgi:hypothetical protein